MLIVYDSKTGEVLDNTGINENLPMGPPGPEEFPDPPAPIKGEFDVEADEEAGVEARTETDEQFQSRLDQHDTNRGVAAQRRAQAERFLYMNVEMRGKKRADVSLLRLHDVDDRPTIDRMINEDYTVDVKTKTKALKFKTKAPVPVLPTAASERKATIDAAEAKSKKGDTAGAMTDLFALLRAQ